MRRRTFYRIEYKLRALVTLDENDGNVYATAKQLGLPRATLVDWKFSREALVEQSETLHQHLRLKMSKRLDLVIDQIIESLPEKVASARLGEAARALSLLIDLSNTISAEEHQQQDRTGSAKAKLAALLERYAGAAEDDTDEMMPASFSTS